MDKQYFGTDGIRGRVGVTPITPDFVLRLGWAVGKVLAQQGGGRVVIGKDTRISGYMFESALEAGLSAAGVDICLLGPMPTPAIAYLTRTLRAQAGIVISASHNPYHDNGIKFFSQCGKKFPDEWELAIEAQLTEPMDTVDSGRLGKASRVNDAAGRYIEFCKSTLPSAMALSGVKLVVDCAHGATYHVAGNVFRELGAEVIEMGVSPDGLNINLDCGATKPQQLQQRVLAEKADLGIALDGDGDRLIMVDHQGQVVDGDQLLYVIAKDRLQRGVLSGGVVGTVMTNLGLEIAMNNLGVAFCRTPVGDRHVIAELSQRDWQLGGETSGHILCTDVTTTGDGIVAALQVLGALYHGNTSLQQYVSGMQKLPQVLVNVTLAEKVNLAEFTDIQQAITKAQSRLGEKGRVLLRPSGTEPVIRVMAEGEDAQLVQSVANELAQVVKDSVVKPKVTS